MAIGDGGALDRLVRRTPMAEDEAEQEALLAERRREYMRMLGRKAGKRSAEVRRQKREQKRLEGLWTLTKRGCCLYDCQWDAIRTIARRTGVPINGVLRAVISDGLESAGWSEVLGDWGKPFRPVEWQKEQKRKKRRKPDE